MKRYVSALALMLLPLMLFSGETSKFIASRLPKSAAAKPNVWLSNFSKAKKYAVDHGLPLVAVWSNGDACSHCTKFENACNSAYFKNWMKTSGYVFYFTYPGDGGDGKIGSNVFHWIRKSNTSYPFVRIYWPKGKVDIATVGDTVDGNSNGTTGGKNCVNYLKNKLKKFKAPAQTSPAPVKPYTIEFDPNGATNEMASVTAKVGTARTLPANTLIRPDYSFAGWAKTASGAVAYKNKASVKNLTTVSNGVVTLYAKWTRTVYRGYNAGVQATVSISDCKGWTVVSGSVTGMKWNSSTAKWTGTPTVAKTYTVKYKKGSSTRTRKVVVESGVPYVIAFEPNGATNEMEAIDVRYGVARTLPANTFLRPDYSFAGWAKTATGSVAYKNKASVRNLTAVSNHIVTLYAKWTRTTYRTYYTGVKSTVAISDCKGWTKTSGTIAGMSWSSSTGKWTGTPKTAGTYTIKYKKGSSTRTRKIVVEKDAVIFVDEMAVNRVFTEGDEVVLDISPASHAGAARSVTVTGLPAGLGYADGVITGRTERVGTFKATVTVVSAVGQKLTRVVSVQIGVPEFCIGTFNGFIGFVDTGRLDELALSNRGTFRLAAPSNANLSAKIVTAKGTYALTGIGWLNAGNGVYTADLATADGKHVLVIQASEEATGLAASFHEIGSFTPSYGTTYSVWAQRAPFARNADGTYCDPQIGMVMTNQNVVGTWYFKAYGDGSSWFFDYATKTTANLTLTVKDDGTAQLAGKVGSYAVSASSAVFVFDGDVEIGFVRADFPVPVTVNKVKKTLDIWLNLWFDRDRGHFNARGEGIGAASLETFE